MTRKERGKERERLQLLFKMIHKDHECIYYVFKMILYIFFIRFFNKIMTFNKRKILFDHRMTQLLAEGAGERMIHLRQHL